MRRTSQSQFRYIWFFLLICSFAFVSTQINLHAEQEEDVVLKALKDELARSVDQLQLKDMEKPYYIEYSVEESERFMMRAFFGAVVSSSRDKSRFLQVGVRVGSYDFDNSGFSSPRFRYSSSGFRPLVIEDDYAALRQDIWLATDAAYKLAVEQLAGKKSLLKTKVQTEEVPDFTREEPVISINPRESLKYNRSYWEKLVRSLSEIFKEFPAIYYSGVNFSLTTTNKYFVSSEGTVVRQPVTLYTLIARASTRAQDGMPLKHFVPFLGTSRESMPTEKEMKDAIRKMAEELTALTSAPVLDQYFGPVLVTAEAATEIFAQTLAPQLSGDRPLLMDQRGSAVVMPERNLSKRLNRRVLPPFFTVVDDPTQTSYGKHSLIGAYRVDDQGVPAQKVTLIEDGFLRTLLMSRRPRKEIDRSNGHGRSVSMLSSTAHYGNLFVKATEARPFAELKQELIELCKYEGLSYGLLVRKLDNRFFSPRDFQDVFGMSRTRAQRETVTAPLIVHKVYVEDGREELVRGLSIEEMSVRMLRDIVAAGEDYSVNNLLARGNLPTSVVAPSVLFEEIELSKPQGPLQKPALLKHPYFSKQAK
jgi:predicted Zn-dependent protease